MEIFCRAATELRLSREEITAALHKSLEGRSLSNVLIIPPDYTRFHSNSGLITNIYYHALVEMGCNVDILPALGTHVPVTEAEAKHMFGDIPYEKFLSHNWRTDVMKIGEVPAAYLEEITEGLWHDAVDVEINRRVMDEKYDLIISVGQVVPHEVIGMANHAKNLFVGVGGADMINKSHMVGAVYGMERMMGKDHTPVRKVFDYALTHGNNEIVLLIHHTAIDLHIHCIVPQALGDLLKVFSGHFADLHHIGAPIVGEELLIGDVAKHMLGLGLGDGDMGAQCRENVHLTAHVHKGMVVDVGDETGIGMDAGIVGGDNEDVLQGATLKALHQSGGDLLAGKS